MMDQPTADQLNQLFGLAQTKPARKSRYRWRCPVTAQEMGDFVVLPLTASKELISEGWNMQHCVATYGTQCAAGRYQVFSVRDLLGNRIATLGLAFGDSGWTVDQCLGFGNTDVLMKSVEWIHGNGEHATMDELTDLHYCAQDIARQLNALREA